MYQKEEYHIRRTVAAKRLRFNIVKNNLCIFQKLLEINDFENIINTEKFLKQQSSRLEKEQTSNSSTNG